MSSCAGAQVKGRGGQADGSGFISFSPSFTEIESVNCRREEIEVARDEVMASVFKSNGRAWS